MKGPGVNDKFPNLVGSTQFSNDFDLYQYIGDNWGLVLLHPGDFTPVCTTELGAAAFMAPDFANRHVKLCGFSVDDGSSHREWIRDIEYATGARVEFPLFCDPTREYAHRLGVLDDTNLDKHGRPLTLRAVYILRPDKTIALTMMYPNSMGRDMEEIIRCIDALQSSDWGDDVLVAALGDTKQAAHTSDNESNISNSAVDSGGKTGHKSGKTSRERPKKDDNFFW